MHTRSFPMQCVIALPNIVSYLAKWQEIYLCSHQLWWQPFTFPFTWHSGGPLESHRGHGVQLLAFLLYIIVGPIGCRPYHCFFLLLLLLLLLLLQSLSRPVNIINIFMIWALPLTYHTSPESWGHCLSFRDDNDNDKDTHKDKYKDKDKDNDKDKVLKRPITCYVFEKQGVQGYQIRRLQ